MVKTTVSIIKADVGSLAGHTVVPEPLFKIANERMAEAKEAGLINSFYVFNAGDDLELLMTHSKGENSEEVHRLAWDTFKAAADKAKRLKLYGAGQDLLKDAFSGNVRGMGPGVAEMEFEERGSDPMVVFAADKTEPAAFNYLLYRVFADPFNTAGLVIDPRMAGGFEFEVLDAIESKSVTLKTPEEAYSLIALIIPHRRQVCWQGRPRLPSPQPERFPRGRGDHRPLPPLLPRGRMDAGEPLGPPDARGPKGQPVHRLRRAASDRRPRHPGIQRHAGLGRRRQADGRRHLRRHWVRPRPEGGPGPGGGPKEDGGVRARPPWPRRHGVHDAADGSEEAGAPFQKGVTPPFSLQRARRMRVKFCVRIKAHELEHFNKG